jgi:hypothetical protein
LKNIVRENGFSAGGTKIVFEFDGNRVREIIQKDDRRIGHEIEGLFRSKRKDAGKFLRHFFLVDFILNGAEDDAPILFFPLRFLVA